MKRPALHSQTIMYEVPSRLFANILARASGVPERIQSGEIGAGSRSVIVAADASTIDFDMVLIGCDPGGRVILIADSRRVLIDHAIKRVPERTRWASWFTICFAQ